MPTCFNPGCARELSLGALFCDYCQTPGRVLGSEPDPWAAGIRLVGKSVKDRYRILGMLRADETGFVHAAHDSRTGEGVALRVLPPKIVASPDRLANLQAAVRATVGLEHPNVIPCLEIDAEGRDICLLYPRVDGETVARYLDRRALETGQSGLSSDEALVILEGVADGLDALHRRGVVHRGLRPAVVILTHDGPVIVPRVADACVAQVVRVYLCRLGRPEHFPFGYTPPEEIRGEPVDRAGDLFALGCLAWELLLGRTPYPGTDRSQRILNGTPEGIEQLDERLRSVFSRALDPDATRRWPSGRPFVEALSRVLPRDPRRPPIRHLASARTDPRFPQPEKGRPIERKGSWLPLVVILFAVGALLAYTVGSAAIEGGPRLAPIATIESVIARFDDGPARSLPGQRPTTVADRAEPSVQPSPPPSAAPSPDASLSEGADEDSLPTLTPLEKNAQGYHEFLSSVDEARMVLIPRGAFWMGSRDVPEEGPAHEVWLSAFLIDRTECTAGQYRKFLAAKKRTQSKLLEGLGDQDPVGGVSWMEAQEYLAWAGKTLPSEAQWEKAARGGLTGNPYPWGDQPPSVERACSGLSLETGKPRPVASFPPNGYGVCDCAGNVWEWCLDSYAPDAYAVHAGRDPVATARGGFKVIRGGSFADGPQALRVSARNRLRASIQGIRGVGFRGVMKWKGPEPP